MNQEGLYMQSIKAFDQSILLNALQKEYAKTPNGKQIFTQLKDGICYALSIDWLRQLLEAGKNIPDTIPANYTSGTPLLYYKQIANNYYKFALDFDRTTGYLNLGLPAAGIAEAVRHHGHDFINCMDTRYTELCTGGQATVASTIDCSSRATLRYELEQALASGRECRMMVWLSTTAFAHEMAVYIRAGVLYFYDPNSGIHAGTANEITNEIHRIYAGRQSPAVYLSRWR